MNHKIEIYGYPLTTAGPQPSIKLEATDVYADTEEEALKLLLDLINHSSFKVTNHQDSAIVIDADIM